jgi:hypothetical protein
MMVALLLGFILAAWPVVAVPASSSPAVKSCCCKGRRCCNMACCAVQKDASAPVVPVPVPSSSQNELQVMAASVVTILTLPSLAANEVSQRFSLPAPMTAVPLFQRDCCYLI